MALYSVVITPHDGDTTAPGGQATIVVDTAGPAPRIVEMTLRTSDPQGLISPGASGIDLEGVVRVLASAMDTAGRTAPPPAPEAEAPAAEAPRPTAAPRRRTPRKTAGGKDTDRKAAGSEGTDREGNPERAYRRMPDRAELLSLHEKLGGVTALARHYGVPRHTAQGWMGRARKTAGEPGPT